LVIDKDKADQILTTLEST